MKESEGVRREGRRKQLMAATWPWLGRATFLVAICCSRGEETRRRQQPRSTRKRWRDGDPLEDECERRREGRWEGAHQIGHLGDPLEAAVVLDVQAVEGDAPQEVGWGGSTRWRILSQ